MTYRNQFDAKAAAREAANRLKIAMFIFKSANAFVVSPDAPASGHSIKILPASHG
jgi:hypothetical protein